MHICECVRAAHSVSAAQPVAFLCFPLESRAHTVCSKEKQGAKCRSSCHADRKVMGREREREGIKARAEMRKEG